MKKQILILDNYWNSLNYLNTLKSEFKEKQKKNKGMNNPNLNEELNSISKLIMHTGSNLRYLVDYDIYEWVTGKAYDDDRADAAELVYIGGELDELLTTPEKMITKRNWQNALNKAVNEYDKVWKEFYLD